MILSPDRVVHAVLVPFVSGGIYAAAINTGNIVEATYTMNSTLPHWF